MPGSAFCSAHGFSTTGEAGNWTWIGGGHAPYNFTSAVVGGGAERSFSTRERPWGLLGGPHGDEWLALVNGVSGGVGRPGEFIKYIAGRGASVSVTNAHCPFLGAKGMTKVPSRTQTGPIQTFSPCDIQRQRRATTASAPSSRRCVGDDSYVLCPIKQCIRL
eukprot:SAG25_NODE_324_length_9786_cov_33.460308_3_plen_162_part_00